MAETAAYPPFYTLNQQKALVWGPRVTSVLSILGSTIVLYMIYVDRAKKLKRIYHRIIFVWSCFSVLISLMGMLSTLPSPKEGGYYGSLGNTATCTAQGFLWHWAFAATMVYNGILSLYYISTVKYSVPERLLSQRVEPYIHAFAIGYTFCFCVGLAITGNYNPGRLTMGCWLHSYPIECGLNDLDCSRGQHANIWMWLFFGVEFNLGSLVKVIAVPVLGWTVYQQEVKMRTKYNVISRQQSNITKQALIQAWYCLCMCGAVYIVHLGVRLCDMFGMFGSHDPRGQQVTTQFFVFSLIGHLCFPSQGVWMLFIYLRPRYANRRKLCAEETRWETLLSVLSSTPLPNQTQNARNTRKYISSSQKLAKDNASNCGTEVEDVEDRSGEEEAIAVDALEGDIHPDMFVGGSDDAVVNVSHGLKRRQSHAIGQRKEEDHLEDSKTEACCLEHEKTEEHDLEDCKFGQQSPPSITQ